MGCVARAVVFVLVGVFLVKAAVLSSAKQAKGLDAVFRSVASSAYGPWLLAGLASGLVCYGLYCLLEARYRDLTPVFSATQDVHDGGVRGGHADSGIPGASDGGLVVMVAVI